MPPLTSAGLRFVSSGYQPVRSSSPSRVAAVASSVEEVRVAVRLRAGWPVPACRTPAEGRAASAESPPATTARAEAPIITAAVTRSARPPRPPVRRRPTRLPRSIDPWFPCLVILYPDRLSPARTDPVPEPPDGRHRRNRGTSQAPAVPGGQSGHVGPDAAPPATPMPPLRAGPVRTYRSPRHPDRHPLAPIGTHTRAGTPPGRRQGMAGDDRVRGLHRSARWPDYEYGPMRWSGLVSTSTCPCVET